jgi:predicted HTH domain antitoxin
VKSKAPPSLYALFAFNPEAHFSNEGDCLRTFCNPGPGSSPAVLANPTQAETSAYCPRLCASSRFNLFENLVPIADDLRRLLEDAELSEPSLVTRAGQPVVLAEPWTIGLDARKVTAELAARLYDHEQISLGVAAPIAGLAYGEMIDKLGRRDVAVIRLEPGDLERELAAFST